MYQEFYGLKEKPFSLTPDPQFLYLSESHRTALDYLQYGIEQKEGFIVITGDIGTGKTTICRTFLEKLDKRVKTAVIFNSFLTEGKLLEAILQDFGFPCKGRTKYDRIQALNKFLLELSCRGENAVVIIDEAQNLSIPVLEQIRMLSNLETEKEKMLQIVFLGQLELDRKLKSPHLKQLNQRIAIRHHLTPLTRTEMESYIYQRLIVAGSQGGITFSQSALNEIYAFSKGTPRLINLLCDRALLGGFVGQTYQIDYPIVKRAKKSLLGEEESKKPFYFYTLPKCFKPLRYALWALCVFLLVGMILMNQALLNSFQDVKYLFGNQIQQIYVLLGSHRSSSVSPLCLKRESGSRGMEDEMEVVSGRVFQEVSR